MTTNFINITKLLAVNKSLRATKVSWEEERRWFKIGYHPGQMYPSAHCNKSFISSAADGRTIGVAISPEDVLAEDWYIIGKDKKETCYESPTEPEEEEEKEELHYLNGDPKCGRCGNFLLRCQCKATGVLQYICSECNLKSPQIRHMNEFDTVLRTWLIHNAVKG